ncbi:hypothetical protein [Candidatus Phycosocius spiralis]|uniref:Lipoprotein n=1 Tax=Candidatus Phycosocius spiralis TaxID=2815099 RepID=A0ABQ4PXD5_9PROT|nr:hypothetical protein [Candidatus Phycosocius spiralis]GIU67645.1 hypothetical protein PsB1_1799 [Candidatus Phycosocius spiralis]
MAIRYTLLSLISILGPVLGIGMSACTPKDPLAHLTQEDREYLFAGPKTNAAFLGQPGDGGPIACNPDRMSQGYVLIDAPKAWWLDSIRPTGTERHKILRVETTADGFDITAQNAIGVSFHLLIEQRGRKKAEISWDGAPAESYIRCPGMPS